MIGLVRSVQFWDYKVLISSEQVKPQMLPTNQAP